MTRIVHIMSVLAVLAGVFVPRAASAENKPMIVILPLQASAKVKLDEEDISFLTDVARGTAAKVLGDGYIVQTEQNMQRILEGMGLTLEQCMAKSGDCEVEIARKLQADYAVAGRIRKALGQLKLTIQLYETGSGALLGQHDDTIRKISALEDNVRAGVGSLLSTLPGALGRAVSAPPPTTPLESQASGSNKPPSAEGAETLSAGHDHTCGVKANGSVACWGRDWHGNAIAPTEFFQSVSAGESISCGVRTTGTLACWGDGVDTSPPLGTFRSVSAGTDHACGVTTDGSAVCWGTDVHFPNIPPAGSFSSVAAGDEHSCGVKTDGNVVCWSLYDSGQTHPPPGPFQSISAGRDHMCGVRTDGRIACWGDHDAGQSSPPSGTFLSVSAGDSHTCGLRTNGSVACWGLNEDGQSSPPGGLRIRATR